MILRNAIQQVAWTADTVKYAIIIGIFSGIAMGMSAYFQGKAGARAADALAETGKGFGNYIMVLGVIETVALFVMVFAMTALPNKMKLNIINFNSYNNNYYSCNCDFWTIKYFIDVILARSC